MEGKRNPERGRVADDGGDGVRGDFGVVGPGVCVWGEMGGRPEGWWRRGGVRASVVEGKLPLRLRMVRGVEGEVVLECGWELFGRLGLRMGRRVGGGVVECEQRVSFVGVSKMRKRSGAGQDRRLSC